MVLKANPSENSKAVADLADLLLRIRALICKLGLAPCVRTKYNRVALQSASSNRCRLTVDRDITVVNERAGRASSWCLPDDEVVPEEDVVKLPYCVYEVKVADGANGPPVFVADLEDRGAIVEAKKFSKFLSGASVFNAERVETLPWWAEDPAFVPLYRSGAPLSANGRGPFGFSKNSDHTESVSSSDSVERFKEDGCEAIEEGIPTSGTKSSSSLWRRKISRRGVLLRRASTMPILPKHKRNRIAPKTRLRVEPKSHFANVSRTESTGGIRAANLAHCKNVCIGF